MSLTMILPEKNRKDYPRVTTVLKNTMSVSKRKSLGYWRATVGKEEAERISEEAKTRGNRFHLQAENFARGLKEHTYISPSIEAFLIENEIQIVLCEQKIYNDELIYQGRLDMLYWSLKRSCYGVLDWKTSYKPRPPAYFSDHKLQVSAYAKAIELMYSITVSEAMIVVAVPKLCENNDPFAVPEELWDFQTNFQEAKTLKRSFNRFAKKVEEFRCPAINIIKDKNATITKSKPIIPLICPNDPFSVC